MLIVQQIVRTEIVDTLYIEFLFFSRKFKPANGLETIHNNIRIISKRS